MLVNRVKGSSRNTGTSEKNAMGSNNQRASGDALSPARRAIQRPVAMMKNVNIGSEMPTAFFQKRKSKIQPIAREMRNRYCGRNIFVLTRLAIRTLR